MEISGLPVTTTEQSIRRFSCLLWGPSGAGKTTLAATAPGKKLLVNFDPDGPASIATRTDVDVLDLSGQGHKILEQLRGDDPLKLSKVLSEETYDTVILDSVTALSQNALERGVDLAKSRANQGEPATLEFPGLQGYGARTTISVAALKAFLRVTGRYGVHFIATTHEDDPTVDKRGNMLYVTMMLGGKIKNNVALQLSEIWHLSETDKSRRVAVRPCRGHQPMKTRMFKTDGSPEFVLKYNPNIPDEEQTAHTIAGWWETWNETGKAKLELPK